MRSIMFIIVFSGLIVILQGCNTFKGATDGFKEDWKILVDHSNKLEEQMW